MYTSERKNKIYKENLKPLRSAPYCQRPGIMVLLINGPEGPEDRRKP
jgi:hypothetical protein